MGKLVGPSHASAEAGRRSSGVETSLLSCLICDQTTARKMGFMKNLKKKANKAAGQATKMAERAAQTAQHPMELTHLDAVVDELSAKFDGMIDGFEADIPPTPEEAVAKEDEWIGELNSEYWEKAKGITERDPKDEKDSMQVRNRMLNRKLNSRKGKLLARFSDEIGEMKDKAISVLTDTCQAELDEFAGDILERLPMKPSELEDAGATMLAQVEDNVNAAYPGGVDALDNFDDDLGDCLSYADWKNAAASKIEELGGQNEEAREEAKKGYLVALYLSICDDMDDDDDLVYFEDNGEDYKAEIRNKIAEALDVDPSTLEE
jgi:hypothetical protein